jgi:hypothetical protein
MSRRITLSPDTRAFVRDIPALCSIHHQGGVDCGVASDRARSDASRMGIGAGK